jgi:hypothetical protein
LPWSHIRRVKVLNASIIRGFEKAAAVTKTLMPSLSLSRKPGQALIRSLAGCLDGRTSDFSRVALVGTADDVGTGTTRPADDIAMTTSRIRWDGWFASSSFNSRTILLPNVIAYDTKSGAAMTITMNAKANTIGRPPGLT